MPPERVEGHASATGDKPDHVEHAPGDGFGIGKPLAARAESHVVEDGHPGKQRVLLKYDAAKRAWRKMRTAVEIHRAARGTQKPGEHIEERGFSATARPEKGNEFSRLDIERNIEDGCYVASRAAEAYRYAVESQISSKLNWSRAFARIDSSRINYFTIAF